MKGKIHGAGPLDTGTTNGFGGAFANVDRPGAKIDYYDQRGRKLASFGEPIPQKS